ncbi:MAG: 1,4-dihydroxy-6-naphthoate synthase [Proteobacteria bacterium]|nr:1,4-dihydroxy-6-naphthoate synthase [Pseudomonadota bacterium]
MTALDIGFSPCPNDTSIFHAMIHGFVDTEGLSFMPHIFDVEELNRKAFDGIFPVTKLSFYAWLKLKESYDLIDSGAALGYGCGPLLVGKTKGLPGKNARIAIPGEYTTAHLLLKLWNNELTNVHITRFDKIMKGVKEGVYDAGLIIHEGRFVYQTYGLEKIVDLGEWWEQETGFPIPLGCIAIRKDKKTSALKSKVESILKKSVLFSLENRYVSREYVKTLAQEMDDQVIDGHIDLYVNRFTVSLGTGGLQAIQKLEEMASCRNIL